MTLSKKINDVVRIAIDEFISNISNEFGLNKNELHELWEKTNGIPNNIKNKGTGAGGSNTNKNGLPYEELTDLSSEFEIKSDDKNSKQIVFNIDDRNTIFTYTKQSRFFKCMEKHVNKDITKAHGCKKPDECYINENTIFIIEKKFQQCSGSICEKIQTPDFKLWQYNRTFPSYNIVYIYCLSDWFKKNCKAEIEYLIYKKIPFFWGNNKTYKDDIINFILNYKQ